MNLTKCIFPKELDESPDLRAAATLRSLSRIRTELERIPETAALGDPVELRLQDALVISFSCCRDCGGEVSTAIATAQSLVLLLGKPQ